MIGVFECCLGIILVVEMIFLKVGSDRMKENFDDFVVL